MESGTLYALPMPRDEKLIGPRGGETTRKPGQVKKTVWLHEDEAEAVRAAAFKERVSEATLIRTAIRRFFELSD
jgi:hypothetical protein